MMELNIDNLKKVVKDILDEWAGICHLYSIVDEFAQMYSGTVCREMYSGMICREMYSGTICREMYSSMICREMYKGMIYRDDQLFYASTLTIYKL